MRSPPDNYKREQIVQKRGRVEIDAFVGRKNGTRVERVEQARVERIIENKVDPVEKRDMRRQERNAENKG